MDYGKASEQDERDKEGFGAERERESGRRRGRQTQNPDHSLICLITENILNYRISHKLAYQEMPFVYNQVPILVSSILRFVH